MDNNNDVLLSLRNVKTYFPVKKGVFRRTIGYVKAVDGIDLDVLRGETLGLVGESGCGKTTLGKSILRLYKETKGSITYNFADGERDLLTMPIKELNKLRSKLQIVFQDPHSSLNPSFTVFGSLEDPLRKFGVRSRTERKKIVGDLLESVNMQREYMNMYPNEFSGGQRQRIGIARALSVQPELIICDEAVSSLDVSVQAQVLNLLKELKKERNLTYIFITHDLGVVEYISDRIAVMYLGKIVELSDAEELNSNSMHPYTKALLSAVPIPDLDKKSKRTILHGDVPSPVNPPSGCTFHPRCVFCMECCKLEEPKLIKYRINEKEHYVACHLMEGKYQKND